MKSMMRRPSEYLPAGAPKKVSPLGGGAGPKAADNPPVSELESPKLKMAGKSHGGPEKETGTSKKSNTTRNNTEPVSLDKQWEAIDKQ